MREQTKNGRYGSEDKCDSVEKEGVCDPFDENIGNLNGELISDETVDVYARGWELYRGLITEMCSPRE